MTHELLDLQRIRRNWSRGDTALLEPVPDRLGHVSPPLDAMPVGTQLMDRLRRELHDQFPDQHALLAPFVARADALLARLREESSAALRSQLIVALRDLEDLCEALLSVRP